MAESEAELIKRLRFVNDELESQIQSLEDDLEFVQRDRDHYRDAAAKSYPIGDLVEFCKRSGTQPTLEALEAAMAGEPLALLIGRL